MLRQYVAMGDIDEGQAVVVDYGSGMIRPARQCGKSAFVASHPILKGQRIVVRMSLEKGIYSPSFHVEHPNGVAHR